METNSQLNLVIGKKSIKMELNGLDVEVQEKMLQAALASFFDELKGISPENVTEEPTEKEIKEAASILGYKEEDFAAALEAFDKATEPEQPERNERSYLSTPRYLHNGSAKMHKDGKTVLYKTYYLCEDCRHRGKHWLPAGTPFCNCHECGKQNKIRPAIAGEPMPHIDEWGNVFIAGDFLRTDERDYQREDNNVFQYN